MPTSTTNFSFNKPLVNDPIDEDIWGGQLNTNWDSIDGILPVPAASKFGAVVVQSTDDASFEIISGQGTSGQVLTSNGSDALPSFQSNAWILLETQTASASSSIDFTSNIDSSFNKYSFEIINWIPSTGALLQMRVSTDGGSTFKSGASDYAHGNFRTNGASAMLVITDEADDVINIHGNNNVPSSDSAKGSNFTIKMSDPASTSTNASFEITGGIPDTSVLQQKPFQTSAKYVGATTAVDAIRFLQDSGTITSGIFKLYGIS